MDKGNDTGGRILSCCSGTNVFGVEYNPALPPLKPNPFVGIVAAKGLPVISNKGKGEGSSGVGTGARMHLTESVGCNGVRAPFVC